MKHKNTSKPMQIRVMPKLAERIRKVQESEPAWASHNQIANRAIAAGLKHVESLCEVEG